MITQHRQTKDVRACKWAWEIEADFGIGLCQLSNAVVFYEIINCITNFEANYTDAIIQFT